MSKKDITSSTTQLQEMVRMLPTPLHLRLHWAFNPAPVPQNWQIEKGRINRDLHLLYVIEGEGYYRLGPEETPIALESGRLIFVSNGYPHSGYPIAGKEPHTYSIRFGVYTQDEQFLPDYFKHPFAVDTLLTHPVRFHRLFRQLHQAYIRQAPSYNAHAHAILTQILIMLSDHMQSNSTQDIDPIIESVLPYMHHSTPSLQQLAGQVNLSTKQFSRRFHKAYHMTPHQYMIRSRIQEAQFLLEETDLPIKTIAHRLGYCDAYAFSKQFKSITGDTPTSIRR